MNRIKVARIITRLNVGGPAYQATLLNHLLPQRGYDCLLIHGRVPPGETFFGSLLEKYPGPNIQISSLSRKIAPVADYSAYRQLVRALREFKPDIVHTHTAKAGLLGRLAGKMAGAKALVHTYHGHVLDGYFTRPVEKMIIGTERFLAAKTDCLVTISPRLTAELSQRFKIAPADKFATIELGIPLNQFRQLPPRGPFRTQFNIPENALVLGSLGRLVHIKNYHRLIQVFHGLTQQFPTRDFYLLIGGTGPLEGELKNESEKLGLSRRIHFLGLVEDLPQFYADIDIAVLTSDNEGTPVAILEAQAAGKYCVAPDVGGIGDCLYPQAGQLISPNQTQVYINVLGSVIENWPELKNSPETIRTTVIDRFSPDRLVRDIDALYKKLLEKKR
jgi:glycosyltransferase involved in cell wall biosynthesis